MLTRQMQTAACGLSPVQTPVVNFCTHKVLGTVPPCLLPICHPRHCLKICDKFCHIFSRIVAFCHVLSLILEINFFFVEGGTGSIWLNLLTLLRPNLTESSQVKASRASRPDY